MHTLQKSMRWDDFFMMLGIDQNGLDDLSIVNFKHYK